MEEKGYIPTFKEWHEVDLVKDVTTFNKIWE